MDVRNIEFPSRDEGDCEDDCVDNDEVARIRYSSVAAFQYCFIFSSYDEKEELCKEGVAYDSVEVCRCSVEGQV